MFDVGRWKFSLLSLLCFFPGGFSLLFADDRSDGLQLVA
jgi:hypothetical protein